MKQKQTAIKVATKGKEIMDTSKFSLAATYALINPIKDHLVFRPLSDLWEETRIVGQTSLSLKILPEVVRSPLTITGQSMVYPVIINRIDCLQFVDVTTFNDSFLFCHRNREEEAEWLYMQTKYVRRSAEVFFSEHTDITSVNDKNLRQVMTPGDHFAEHLFSSVTRWVALSISRREKILAKLSLVSTDLLQRGIAAVQE